MVSPLVALMHDQVKSAPKELNAVMLWSGQTPAQAQEVLNKIAVRDTTHHKVQLKAQFC